MIQLGSRGDMRYPVMTPPVQFSGEKTAAEIPSVFKLNDKGDFFTPSHVQYYHQWLWDAAFHAIILSRFDIEKAKREINTLLKAQWPDGMIPHIQFNPAVKAVYRPNADDWNTGHATSGITQPPLVATAVREMYEQSGDLDYLRKVYPAVLKFHKWMKTYRDQDGLVAMVHPWESGTDNSPMFDAARERLLKEYYAKTEPPPRADTKNIPAEQRPKADDYKVYWGLIQDFQNLGWQQDKMVQHSNFLMADPLFNSVWIKANDDLAAMADTLADAANSTDDFKRLKQDANQLRNWADNSRKAMREKLWSEKDGFFYPYDFRTKAQVPVKTVHGLVPLYANVPDKPMARRLIQEHLRNPDEFSGLLGVPSTAFNESAFDNKRYWRGPIWINTEWFIIKGLQKYRYDREAQSLINKSKSLIEKSGYREYYDPANGSGLGAPDFCWSALADIL